MISQLHLKQLGLGVEFIRIRRITGYLVSDLSQWNNAKASELRDRVKHVSMGGK